MLIKQKEEENFNYHFMIHELNLHNDPFQKILTKNKTIEMRLNDERRKNIKIGDILLFKNRFNNETIKCSVVNIYIYKNFEDLYKHHDKKSLGYKEDEIANPKDMNLYYSDEQINKYGVLGIEIKLV